MIFYTMNLNYANESPMYGLVNLISDSGIIRNHNNDIFFLYIIKNNWNLKLKVCFCHLIDGLEYLGIIW